MVHVPLNAGTLILYKYLPSPIIFEDKDVALYVKDEEKFLAMDAHQTIGLQMTPREFDKCLKTKESIAVRSPTSSPSLWKDSVFTTSSCNARRR